MVALLLTAVLASQAATKADAQVVGPTIEVVKISKIDRGEGKFTITRTIYEYVSHLTTTNEKVQQKVSSENVREEPATYSLKHWRLTNKKGDAVDLSKAEGKTVVFYRSNQLPEKAVLQLLAKDALILYGRE